MGQVRRLQFSAETVQGQYQDDIIRQSSNYRILCTFCGSGYSVRRMGYYHRYAAAGGSLAYALRPWSGPGIQTIGLGFRVGQQQVGYRPLAPDAPFDPSPAAASTRHRLYDFNPYLTGRLGRGRLAMGYRAGLHLGQLRYTATVLADSSLRNDWLAPDALLWAGVRRALFVQFDSGLGPLALGNYVSRVGLGTGLGADDGRYVLAGLAVARHEPGYGMGFLGASVPVGRTGFQLESYAASNFSRHYQLSLQLRDQLPAQNRADAAPQP